MFVIFRNGLRLYSVLGFFFNRSLKQRFWYDHLPFFLIFQMLFIAQVCGKSCFMNINITYITSAANVLFACLFLLEEKIEVSDMKPQISPPYQPNEGFSLEGWSLNIEKQSYKSSELSISSTSFSALVLITV